MGGFRPAMRPSKRGGVGKADWSSAERRKISAVIDVIDGALHDDGRHGLDADRLRLGKALGRFAQMDDFYRIDRRVQRAHKAALGVDADRTTGMIENGILGHGPVLFKRSDSRVAVLGWSWDTHIVA